MTKNLIDQRFGRLRVLKLARKTKNYCGLNWLCACDCGETAIVRSANLLSGNSKSCGCVHWEKLKKGLRFKHGHALGGHRRSREYVAFHSARARCRNRKNASYPRYGGRGIKFKFKSFEQFFRCVGRRP